VEQNIIHRPLLKKVEQNIIHRPLFLKVEQNNIHRWYSEAPLVQRSTVGTAKLWLHLSQRWIKVEGLFFLYFRKYWYIL
jgi:hypothetical protein